MQKTYNVQYEVLILSDGVGSTGGRVVSQLQSRAQAHAHPWQTRARHAGVTCSLTFLANELARLVKEGGRCVSAARR